MTFNLLTTVLTTIVGGLAKAQANIGKANGVMNGLAIIEIVLAALWMATDGASLSEPFKRLMHLSFWFWFATHFPSLAKLFSDSLVQIALAAGGQPGNMSLLLDPSQIAGMALDATFPLVQSIHDAGIGHLADVFLMGTCYLILMACFFLMACHVCVAVIEYYLIVTLASCLIPFGISTHTKFLAEKAIGAVVAVSVKLMVLAFIVALVKPVMAGIHFSGSGGEVLLNEALAMCLVCMLLAILVWRAPGLAADLLTASPSLSAVHVGQHVTSSVTTAAAMYAGAAGAAAKGLSAARAAIHSRGNGRPGPSVGGGGGNVRQTPGHLPPIVLSMPATGTAGKGGSGAREPRRPPAPVSSDKPKG